MFKLKSDKTMKNIGTVILLFFTSLILSNCSGDDYKTDASGLKYKFIIENKEATQPKIGDVITLRMRFTDSKGTTIEQTEQFRTQLKKPSHAGGSIENALTLMHKGDSAIFQISAENYYSKTLEIRTPERFQPGENLYFYIKLMDVVSLDDFEKERHIARLSDKHEEEKLLSDFLEKTNTTVEPTLSGLYFVELKPGSGKTPEPGKRVSVHYLGYFIDGQLFDSSYERKKPFTFTLGVGEVISGWDEGISHMKTGGKYKLIIPSHLAYGAEAVGSIPPYSILVFEIEVLSCD